MNKISFKDWVEQLVEVDSKYSFLLEGYQTGEIFDMHEYYIKGISPFEVVKKEQYLYG